MIQQSFVLLDRVGERKEQRIRNQGISDWYDFIQAEHVKGLSSKSKKYFDRQLMRAQQALRCEDMSYFLQHLPLREHWRLYEHFRDDAVFLDIEIDSISGDLLMVGLYDGEDVKTLVRGNLDMDGLRRELMRHKLLVSFNGSVFDVPFLRKRYPKAIPNMPHLDLRFACKRIGLSGGLKDIEKQLGIERPQQVKDMYGGDVYLLWRKYLATGDDEFLNILIEYNEQDVVNLKPIADHVCEKLAASL